MLDEILKTRKLVKEKTPLIHAITNPISINDCANFILTTGAKPFMAEHPKEVCEITETADALALNIANITDARMLSIALSAKTAEQKVISSIIDAVGVSCSRLRYDYIQKLLSEIHFSAIKGNIAEINALLGIKTETIGIDVKSKAVDMEASIENVEKLAEKYGCVVMASGKTDIISDGKKTVLVKNGSAEMSLVTGTGCVLNVLSAVYMSVSDAFVGCISAAVLLGICGEISDHTKGMASFKNNMLDKLYTLTDDEIMHFAKIEYL